MEPYSPLRYPGGKAKLAPLLKDVCLENSLSDCNYYEPYAGGAGVALELLMEGYVWRATINDLDEMIHSFWYSVLKDTERLCQLINDTPVTLETWDRQKQVQLSANSVEPLELGFATFFLNRTCRSGTLNGGVIGGKDQNGKYKIDARYNKQGLIQRIEDIALFADRISLCSMDGIQLVAEIVEDESDNLVYLDPPYFNKGQHLYRNYYREADHQELAEALREFSLPWITTYDDVSSIRELYSWSPSLDIALSYSAFNGRRQGNEVLFFGNIQISEQLIRKYEGLIQSS